LKLKPIFVIFAAVTAMVATAAVPRYGVVLTTDLPPEVLYRMTGVRLCKLLQGDEGLTSACDLQERSSQGELVRGQVLVA
jgi:hypothetical protein